MNKYKPLLLLVVAVIIGLVTSILLYDWLKEKTTLKKAAFETTPVVVAATDLSWGAVLKKDMLKPVSFLKGSLPESEYFADTSSLEGRVLVTPVRAHEPILKSRLSPDSVSAGGVAAIVDTKKRAMAVRVDKVIGVSGFVHPGHRVDVLVTIAKTEQVPNTITKIVLENIPVLATGTEMEQRNKNEKPVQVDVITLEVSPEEAEKLALASTHGKIQLALRNYNTTDDVLTNGATLPALLASYKANVKPKAERTYVKKADFKVELIKGGSVSEVKFKGGE